MTNIIDGMDAARFKSKNTPNPKDRLAVTKEKKNEMPRVLKNLKNGS